MAGGSLKNSTPKSSSSILPTSKKEIFHLAYQVTVLLLYIRFVMRVSSVVLCLLSVYDRVLTSIPLFNNMFQFYETLLSVFLGKICGKSIAELISWTKLNTHRGLRVWPAGWKGQVVKVTHLSSSSNHPLSSVTSVITNGHQTTQDFSNRFSKTWSGASVLKTHCPKSPLNISHFCSVNISFQRYYQLHLKLYLSETQIIWQELLL